MLLSPRLWFGVGRSFPRAPILNVLPEFVSAHDYLVSALLLVALVLSAISRHPRVALLAIAVFTLALAFLDLTRLQPWVYQYLIMLSVLACAPPKTNKSERLGPIFAASQLVVAMLYFWSGAQKLNWSFAHDVVPALLQSAGLHFPQSYFTAIALVIVVCEILIGVGLLIPRARRAAVLLALATHVSALSILVATGRNSVVWPWNIAMMIMVVLLFWGCKQTPFEYVLGKWRSTHFADFLPKVVVIICGLMPTLSFVGWWDQYLSAALYSGRTPIAVMHVNQNVLNRLPAKANENVFTTSSGELMLPFHEWSLSDLNVPPYPESRVYRQIARQLCRLTDDPQQLELIVRESPRVTDGGYEVSRTSCASLSPR